MSNEIVTDIFLGMRHRLFDMATAILHSDAEAEDILHDAFVKTWESDIRDDPRRASGSLVVTLRNLCIDRLRRRRFSSDEMPADLRAVSSDPLETRDRIQWAMKVIDTQLSPHAAAVFRMYVVEELDYEEIAERCRISIDSARAIVSRARKLLRNKFRNE